MKSLNSVRVVLLAMICFYCPVSSADFLTGALAYQKKDYSTAYKEFNELAKKGNANGQGMLALLYYKGHGVPQDYRMAATLYEASANQGDLDSQIQFAKMLFDGVGIEKNHALAAKYFEKAAAKGAIDAMFSIGILYMRGDGVEVDLVQAHKWFNLASSYSESDVTSEFIRLSKEFRSKIELEMSKEQLQNAQTQATEWHLAKKAKDDAAMREQERKMLKLNSAKKEK
jgi:TPR repeat protein